ncbi:MAG: aminotransferase class V-fold PLP-dependent enzyme [Spirochaetia bacterium]|nr:aminotransferase class V-fold PLP-dependent enzyme [Spirochaetia bacterium]
MSILYFDHASGSRPKPEFVIKAAEEHMQTIEGSAFRSSGSNDIIELYRENLSSFLNLKEDQTLVFTKNATEAINLFFSGFEKNIQHYFIDSYSHNAVLRPVYKLCEKNKSQIHIISRQNDFINNLEDIIQKSFNNQPAIVCVNAASNVTGEVLSEDDFTRLFEILRKHENLYLLFDFAQYVGSLQLPDFPDEIRDKIVGAASGHKYLLSPESVGFLFFHKNINITPLIYGGVGFDSAEKQMPKEYPYKLEAGTYPSTALCGLNAAVEKGFDFFESLYEKKLNLGIAFYEEIKKNKDFHIFGCKPEIGSHSLTFSLAHENLDCSELAFILYENFKIIAREGLHCSPLVFQNLPEIFQNGTLRISFGWNTSEDDLSRLLAALREIG